MNIREKIRNGLVFCDGGLGTLLQSKGLAAGEKTEMWNLTHPEVLTQIHTDYFEAGSDIVCANTFGANELKFDGADGTPTVEEIITAAVKNAKTAAEKTAHLGRERYVALDVGSLGKLLAPLGELEFEHAVEIFARQVRCGAEQGVDLIFIETMNDAYELKAAVLAAKENCDLPVFATVAFDENGKLMTGADVPAVVALLEGLGVDALGVNCSVGPDKMRTIVKTLAEYSSLPVIVNPNAGMPVVRDGKTVYDISAAEFAAIMKEIVADGARIVGGCCGTTPEYIEKTVAAVKAMTPVPLCNKNKTLVSSYTHAVEIGKDPVLIGERINPTGKPKIKQALKDNNIEYILGEGLSQAEKGVHILDVNVGLPGINESAMLCFAMQELQKVLSLPLQLDSADAAAMEKAMRLYNGKPMVNSVNGKAESMAAVFPLVKKYGGVVVALTLDEGGIPSTAEGRAAIAEKIINTAAKYGIDKKDIVVDPLAMAVSSDIFSACTTLDALKIIKENYGVCTSLGVSNISFGLPNRDIINSTFFAMALKNGLDAAIMNPHSADMLRTYYAFRTLSAMDNNCADYIAYASSLSPESVPAAVTAQADTLTAAVAKGLRDKAATLSAVLLETLEPLDVINNHIVPALDTVGKEFESGKAFLPQLLMAADAAKAAFDEVKKKLGASKSQGNRILIATVKGDIHDIGKNIVKVLLENYGYDVIDMGRDVDPAAIAGTAAEQKIKLVGLSALMTTTVASMEETVKLLHEKSPESKIMVGGAVLTADYAAQIGADYYAKDALEGVKFAKEVFSE